MDNVNTHSIASLYRPSHRKRLALAGTLEIHHTTKYGSWLNIAEIELSALTKQCLGRRLPELEVLNEELAAWASATNADQTPSRLEIHHQQRPHQTPAPIPTPLGATVY